MNRFEIPPEHKNAERFCPICMQGSSTFGSYGDAEVPDARCPNCTTMERYRLLYLYLYNETDFFTKQHTVLDIAPRKEFAQLCKKTPLINYVSIDLMSSRAMALSDVTKLALPSNTFDYIFCYHVLEHVPEQPALKELHRVLQPNGSLFIQVPIDISRNKTFEVSDATPDQYEQLYGQKDHIRVYGTNFDQILYDANFFVTISKYAKQFTHAERIQLGLKDTYKLKNYTTCEDIYIARK